MASHQDSFPLGRSGVLAPAPGFRRPRPSRAGMRARLLAGRLDRALTAGVEPWRSRTLAARAVQLTGTRSRRSLAGALERLVADSDRPSSPFAGAVIRPLCDQVLEARPELLALADRLRADVPVDARGVARLKELITDGNGPCYVAAAGGALVDRLRAIDRALDIPT